MTNPSSASGMELDDEAIDFDEEERKFEEGTEVFALEKVDSVSTSSFVLVRSDIVLSTQGSCSLADSHSEL